MFWRITQLCAAPAASLLSPHPEFSLLLRGPQALPDHLLFTFIKENAAKSCFFCFQKTHNGGMRFKPIAIAIGLTIGGAVATAFSTPPYPLQMPSIIEHAKGMPAVLRIRAWNLRPHPATFSYLGDCCSLKQSATLPPFSSRLLEVELRSEKLPDWTINKVATFQISAGSQNFVKGVPYQVKVKRQ